MKFMNYSKSILVEQHFHSNFQDFDKDVRFAIRERGKKDKTSQSYLDLI